MLKIFTVKKEEKTAESTSAQGKTVKVSAGELRLQKDLSELNLPRNATITFPEGNDKIMHFEIMIQPDEGCYKDGKFQFEFTVAPAYPHAAPKVKCRTKVFHPNIDLDGNICLNILREDWKPVLSINSIIYGLQFLFMDPNPEDPLNKDAAKLMQDNRALFEQQVHRSIRQGQTIAGVYFPACM